MTDWIIPAIYALGYLASWRTVCWFFATELASGPIDGEALTFGIALGTLVTAFWPLIVMGMAARGIYAIRGQEVTLLIIPRGEKRRTRVEMQARRIAELERELGIR